MWYNNRKYKSEMRLALIEIMEQVGEDGMNCRIYPEKFSCFLDIFTVKYKYLEEKARTMQ